MRSELFDLLVVLNFLLWPKWSYGVLHCPRKVDMPPVPDNFMDLEDNTSDRGATGYLFSELLSDEPLSLSEPELGVTYAMWAFKPGTQLENFCNGGAQFVRVEAQVAIHD